MDLFERLREKIPGNVESIIKDMFPNGQTSGEHWRVKSITGEKGDALAINLHHGGFFHFNKAAANPGEDSGDFIRLYQLKNGFSEPIEGAKSLAVKLGVEPGSETRKSHKGNLQRKPIAYKPDKVDVTPVIYRLSKDYVLPEKTIKERIKMHKDYKSHTVYYYRNKDRSIHHIIMRIDKNESKKTYGQFYVDGEKLIKKKPKYTIPYNLPNLKPGRPVLIVEGEKSVHEAFELIQDTYSVTTGSGGTSSICKTDWTYLKDLDAVLWPDNDEGGKKAMSKLADILKTICKTVSIIKDPEERPEKWDVADAIQKDGWDKTKLLDFIETNKKEPEPEPPKNPPKNKIQNEPPHWDEPPIEMMDIPFEIAATGSSNVIPFEQPKRGRPKKPVSQERQDYMQLWAQMGLQLKTNGEPYQNEANILKIFENSGMGDFVYYDEFYARIFIDKKILTDGAEEIKDNLVTKLLIHMQQKYGMHGIKSRMFLEVLEAFALTKTRNSAREWIDTLKWDGVKRCDDFWQNAVGCEDNEYSRGVSRYFWMGLIGRIYKPGGKVDCMVILEGDQGYSKSEIGKILGVKIGDKAKNFNAGSRFFKDDLDGDFGKKEWKRSIQGAFICEIAELNGMSKADVNTLKHQLTVTNDGVRAHFKNYPTPLKRQCIFIGTTNEVGYIKDQTGGRRFLPLICQKADLDYVADNRDQFFAEAKHRFDHTDEFDNGGWWEVPGSKEEQSKRSDLNDDLAVDAVRDYVDGRGPESHVQEPLTNTNIFRYCLDDLNGSTSVLKIPYATHKKIRGIMLFLGFDKNMVADNIITSNGKRKTVKVWTKDGKFV